MLHTNSTFVDRSVFAAFALSFALSSGAFAQAGGAPLPVTVANPVLRKVTETADFTGRFQASASVQITARVSGYLQDATFEEGTLVKEGDVLFRIDPRPFQATVDQSTALVQVAQTKLDLARINLTRAEDLRKSGNVTDAAFQANQQAFLEAQANIDSARAALDAAKLNLDFSEIKAPITGKIGRKLVTKGNLVIGGGQSQGTALTTIVAVDPIYFAFDIDEASFLTYKRLNRGGSDPAAADGGLKVAVSLPDEKTFSHEGMINYVDTQLDSATGTVSVRAVLPNKDGFLTPGLFGRVRVAVSQPYDAMILPDAAVGSSAQGHYVVTVAADGTVGIKPVVTGPKFGSLRAIKSGLTPDDQVIVNGLMRARPGGKVAPQLAPLDIPDDLTALNGR